MEDYQSTQTFVDLKIYQKDPFFLKFTKKKTEKAYLIDSFSQNSFLLKSFLGATLLIAPFKFSQDPQYFFEFQGLASEKLILYLCFGGLIFTIRKFIKITVPSTFIIRTILAIIIVIMKLKILENYEYKTAFISILSLDIIFSTFCAIPFYINLINFILGNAVIFYHFQWAFSNFFYLFMISGSSSYLSDLNSRKNWICFDQQRKGFKIFMYLYGNSINPHFIIDDNKRILSMNMRAQEIYEFSHDSNVDNHNQRIKRSATIRQINKLNFLKLLRPSVQESFEEQLFKAKEFHTSAFSFELVLPTEYSGREDLQLRYTEAETRLLKDLLGNESLFDEFKDENVNTIDTNNSNNFKTNKSQANIFIDIHGNGNGPSTPKEGEKSALEMFFDASIRPILWASRPCFLLEFKDILSEKNILLRTLDSYEEIHENLLEILGCLENDYIKWTNLQSNGQGALLIKDGDLKNLANSIYLINSVINRVNRKKETISFFVGDEAKIKKKFHVQNTFIYLLEVFLLKSVDKLWEINLSFEESFPDFVCGDYFSFKTAISIFLKIAFIYTNFPKHSKFRIHCRLKEIDNSSHDGGKYVLGFDFDMPRYEKQVQLFDILLTHPLFSEISKIRPLFLHPSNRCENKQEFLMFRMLLVILNCKHYVNNQDTDRFMVCFEIPFSIVNELETFLGQKSSRTDLHTSSNHNVNNLTPSRICYNHKLLNLTSLRNTVKKNHFVWKPKLKKPEKPHHAPIISQMKSTKDMKRENSNNNMSSSNNAINLSPTEIKRNEEQPMIDQIIEEPKIKLKKQGSSSSTKVNTEELVSKKSFKRRESKLDFVPKVNSATKLDIPVEEIKLQSSENDQSNQGGFDHRKSHFSISQGIEENLTSLNKLVSAQKISSSIFKLKSRDPEVFPPVLRYKLSELENEKTDVLKKMLMKDSLILLKQHVLSQQKKMGLMFKSEIYIPRLNGEMDDVILKNERLKQGLKFNSFSSLEELHKLDYQAYRTYILNKCPELDLVNIKNSEFFRKIESDGPPPLSKESKPFFSCLFSSNQQKNFNSLQRKGYLERIPKQRSVSVRPHYPNLSFSKIGQVKEIFLNIPQKTQPKETEDEEIQILIVPYLSKIPKNDLPAHIMSRLETRLSGWNQAGSRAQSMGLLRMKKIKKHMKFSILVNDDNINSFQVFKKFQYNSKLQVHYGQSFTNSLDVFRDFLENGFNYDAIFIDLKGKTMNGYELMKNIRGIEKLTNSISSKIIGILGNKEDDWNTIEEKGIDQFIYRPIDENLIMNIINNINTKVIF